VARPRHVLHLVLTLCTAGVWGLGWILVWWTADANNTLEEQRYRREWAAYQVALAEWRWRHQAYGGPPSAV
jgi:hypothetical protein